MTSLNPAVPSGPASGRWRAVVRTAGRLAAGAGAAVRSSAAPVASHLREHFYTITGLGLIDAAAFVHSLFTGLIVTGVTTLIFEWKVSE